jgi:hypothetical protein
MSNADATDAAAAPTQIEGTGGALVAFLDYTVAKGHVKRATASAMKVAVREVLSTVEGEDWERRDVRDLDLEDVLRRFHTLRAMKYKPESLHTYGQRFTNAVGMYRDFVADPRSWRPTVRSRAARSRPRTPSTDSPPPSSPAAAGESTASGSDDRPEAAHSRPSLIPYPFPLRDGVLVTLHLPSDLTRREANRLVAFVQSLTVDGEPTGTVSE